MYGEFKSEDDVHSHRCVALRLHWQHSISRD